MCSSYWVSTEESPSFQKSHSVTVWAMAMSVSESRNTICHAFSVVHSLAKAYFEGSPP